MSATSVLKMRYSLPERPFQATMPSSGPTPERSAMLKPLNNYCESHMTPSDIAAWYAATIGTAVFAWDIAKWARSTARVRVSARGNVSYPDGEVIDKRPFEGGGEVSTLAEYCHVEVVNVGGQPTTLIDIEATHHPSLNGQVSSWKAAFITHAGSQQLPVRLGPGEMWSARLDMRHIRTITSRGLPIIRVRTSYTTKFIDTPVRFK